MKKYLVGDTIKLTWVSSGDTPDSLVAAIYDGNEILVDSGSMVSSGSGHYYYNYTIPDSGGQYFAGYMTAMVGGVQYRRAVRFRSILGEVD